MYPLNFRSKKRTGSSLKDLSRRDGHDSIVFIRVNLRFQKFGWWIDWRESSFQDFSKTDGRDLIASPKDSS